MARTTLAAAIAPEEAETQSLQTHWLHVLEIDPAGAHGPPGGFHLFYGRFRPLGGSSNRACPGEKTQKLDTFYFFVQGGSAPC